MHERAVVAGEAQRAPNRRVDEAARLRSGRKCDLKCVPEDLADGNRLTRRAVEEAQLGVVAEAAAGQIEGTQPTDELRPGGRHRRRIGSQEHGGRAEGVKARCVPERSRASGDDDRRRRRGRDRRGREGRRRRRRRRRGGAVRHGGRARGCRRGGLGHRGHRRCLRSGLRARRGLSGDRLPSRSSTLRSLRLHLRPRSPQGGLRRLRGADGRPLRPGRRSAGSMGGFPSSPNARFAVRSETAMSSPLENAETWSPLTRREPGDGLIGGRPDPVEALSRGLS